MKIIKINEKLRLKIAYMPLRLRGTVLTWLMGFNPYFAMSRDTYYRHYEELKETWGIDIKKPPKT